MTSAVTVHDVLSTNCHSLEELKDFCVMNNLSSSHPDVVRSRAAESELESESESPESWVFGRAESESEPES